MLHATGGFWRIAGSVCLIPDSVGRWTVFTTDFAMFFGMIFLEKWNLERLERQELSIESVWRQERVASGEWSVESVARQEVIAEKWTWTGAA